MSKKPQKRLLRLVRIRNIFKNNLNKLSTEKTVERSRGASRNGRDRKKGSVIVVRS